MKKVLILFIFLACFNFSFGQNPEKPKNKSMAIGEVGYDAPEYLITYEVIPYNPNGIDMNTIIFEIPTTEDNYNSVILDKEVTTWFKQIGGSYISEDLTNSKEERWKLIVRSKRIITKGDIE